MIVSQTNPWHYKVYQISEDNPQESLQGQQGLRTTKLVERYTIFPVQSRVLLESEYIDITSKTLATSSSHDAYCVEFTPRWNEDGMHKKGEEEEGEEKEGRKLIADLLANGNEAMMVNDWRGSPHSANVGFLEVVHLESSQASSHPCMAGDLRFVGVSLLRGSKRHWPRSRHAR